MVLLRVSKLDVANRSWGLLHLSGDAFVLRATEYGPNQATDLKAEEDWDIVANDFSGLADALG